MDDRFEAPADPELLAHERTYHAFNMLIRWSMLHLSVVIAGLTVWFATPGGFLGGLATAVVVFAAGYWVVIRREAHQPLDPWAMGR
jgi:hypothetical protein